MRDFRDLSPASFKGFPFQVDKESGSGGRNIPVHEYVRAEDHDTEDMGRKAVKWSVTAYVASDAVDAESSQLFTICTEAGAGALVLPGVDPGQYRCLTVKRSSEKDKLGLIAFELEFVAAGGGGSFVSQLYDLQAVSTAFALAGLVTAALGILTQQDMKAQLSSAIPDFLTAISPVANKTPEASAILEQVNASLKTISDPVAMVVVLATGIRELGASGAGDVSDWIATAARIDAIPVLTASPAVTAAGVAARAASAILSAATWQETAIAAVTAPPLVRQEVQALRASIVAGIIPVLDRLASLGSLDLHDAVNNTVSLAISYLDDFALTVAPLALIRTTRSLPSTALAWKLYGDPDRAGELVAQVASMTPMFMPREMSVTAPTAL